MMYETLNRLLELIQYSGPALLVCPLLMVVVHGSQINKNLCQRLEILVASIAVIITLGLSASLFAGNTSQTKYIWECIFWGDGSPGLFDTVSIQFDRLNAPLLVLMPILYISTSRTFTTSLIWAGINWLVMANDVLTFMAGVLFLLIANLSYRQTARATQPERKNHSLGWDFVSWQLILGGIAWLVGCAAIVRAAPHGLPGDSTTVFSELLGLLQRSAAQHPAAEMLWLQYQLLPSFAILGGVAILAGLFPFHPVLSSSIESSTPEKIIWRLCIAKVALLLLVRFLVEVDPQSWSRLSSLLRWPTLLGLLYFSLLFINAHTTERQLTNLILWSQQFTFTTLLLAPDSLMLAMWCSHVVQLAGITLLYLPPLVKQESHHLSIPKFLGVLSLGGMTNLAGLFLIWDISLQLTTSSIAQASGFVLFAVCCVISVVGQVNLLHSMTNSTSLTDTDELETTRIPLGWIGVALLGSISSILFLNT